MALTSNLPDFSLAPQEYITQVSNDIKLYSLTHSNDATLMMSHSLPDTVTRDHFVGKLPVIGQPTWPTQPSIPPGSVKK